MIKKYLLVFVATGLVGTLNAQITDNTVKLDSKVQVAKEHLRIAEDMLSNVITQDNLESTMASLATQMLQNRKFDTTKPVLVTSFVRLDNLKKTTEFGRVISESMINEMSNRGFNVIEFRGQMYVSVNAQGEYYITRNVDRMKQKIVNSYIVVGTYSRQYGKVMLNARVIDNDNGQIITSGRATYDHGLRNDCVIFKDCKSPRTISIVKE